MTDIKDPKIDEKPPPYECSSCGFSTWSWNEAKHHICRPNTKAADKALESESQHASHSQTPTGQQVEELVRMTLEARTDHPDWSEDRIVQSIMKSFGSRTHG